MVTIAMEIFVIMRICFLMAKIRDILYLNVKKGGRMLTNSC